MIPLHATLSRNAHGNACIVFDQPLLGQSEFGPGELRELGQRLLALAELAVRLPKGGKHWQPTAVQIGKPL